MLRDLHTFSVIAAFCAMAVMVVATLAAGGGIASILYGGMALPFAYIFSLLFGLPLLLLQKYIKLNVYVLFFIYAAAGLMGSVLVLFFLGINVTSATFTNSGFLLTYAPMGLAAATGAWYFSVYRKQKSGGHSVNT
jgi:hypothetical protein